jgi:Mg2+-importing ATPase
MEIFRTVWFLESLCTQTFIIFAIRTTKVPFYKSHPSRLLIISSIFVVLAGIAITLTPAGGLFGFVPITLPYFLFIGAIVAGYIVVGESVKQRFYRDTIKSDGTH